MAENYHGQTDSPNGLNQIPDLTEQPLWTRLIYSTTVGGAVANAMGQSNDFQSDPAFGPGNAADGIGDTINLPSLPYKS